jgi:hypothetical protein
MAHIAQRLLPEEVKIKIREDLRVYCDRFPSLEVAANTLKNVSASTLRNVLNPNFTNIADAMWRSIRAQIGGGTKSDWVHVNTTVTEDLRFIMRETQQEQGFTWAISPPGSGKTATATMFAGESKNVFHLQCDADMSKSDFAVDLARAVGMRVNSQRKARLLIIEVCEYLAEIENPLLILDEGDKLRDIIIAYFITIYNRIHEVAGVIFLSTNYMEKRMDDGLRRNRPGFQELWSRLGRKFYIVDSNNTNDVLHIAAENGVTDQRDLLTVKNDAIAADLDLRRVQKKVVAIRKKNAQ